MIERPLGPRECECLFMLSRGLRPAQIADELGIRYKTVEKHISNARAKLEARTTVEAVVIALRDGTIDL